MPWNSCTVVLGLACWIFGGSAHQVQTTKGQDFSQVQGHSQSSQQKARRVASNKLVKLLIKWSDPAGGWQAFGSNLHFGIWPRIVRLQHQARRTVPLLLEVSPEKLKIGQHISTGSFGTVCWAELDGKLCVAKRAEIQSADHDRKDPHELARRADEYLQVEADVNRLLTERMPVDYGQQRHVAPYLGTCLLNGQLHLIFKACGKQTLEEHLRRGVAGLRDLAVVLDCTESDLPRRVLHEILSALAFIHARGIVHRDVKPANILVDAGARCLRLIDFGSACDAAGWVVKQGLRPDRVPCSVLYVAPEQRLDMRSPYTFDVYSAAMVFLCVAIPSLGVSQDALYDLRIELRDFDHDPFAWRDNPATVPPEGWEAIFGWRSGPVEAETLADRAWDLLTQLIAFDPSKRLTAASALLGPYLNSDCATQEALLPAAEPWTLQGAVEVLGGPHGVLEAEGCALPLEDA